MVQYHKELAHALRNDINEAPVLEIAQLEGQHMTNLQPTATRHRRAHLLFLHLFLFFSFPLDCFWIFDTPVCCLKKEGYDQALTRICIVKKVFTSYLLKTSANKHALLL